MPNDSRLDVEPIPGTNRGTLSFRDEDFKLATPGGIGDAYVTHADRATRRALADGWHYVYSGDPAGAPNGDVVQALVNADGRIIDVWVLERRG